MAILNNHRVFLTVTYQENARRLRNPDHSDQKKNHLAKRLGCSGNFSGFFLVRNVQKKMFAVRVSTIIIYPLVN